MSHTVAVTAEQERLRFEGDLDKWMEIIGADLAVPVRRINVGERRHRSFPA